MEYGDFYDIAEYGNANWKGNFTQKEIACNAYDYLVEFEKSKNDEKPTHTIKELCKLLAEDGSIDAFCGYIRDNLMSLITPKEEKAD